MKDFAKQILKRIRLFTLVQQIGQFWSKSTLRNWLLKTDFFRWLKTTNLFRQLQFKRQHRFIEASNLFDHDYYLARYPQAKKDPISHFMEKVFEERCNPNPFFDSDYYLNNHPNLLREKLNPLVHYLHKGYRQGVWPHPDFDSHYYKKRYFSLIPIKMNPLEHYLLSGHKRGFVTKATNEQENRYQPNVTPPLTQEEAGKRRLALLMHVFYDDLFSEMTDYIFHFPKGSTLLISVVTDEGERLAKEWAEANPEYPCICKRVPNRGRDVAPALVFFREEINQFDLVCKIHSKKSMHRGRELFEWRRHLIDNLVGNESILLRNLAFFEAHPKLGMIFTDSDNYVLYWGFTWLTNRPAAKEMMKLLEIEAPLNQTYLDFPAGTMFWFRPPALRQMLDGRLTLEDFPPEPVGDDGSMMHALERLMCTTAQANGYDFMEVNYALNRHAFNLSDKGFSHYDKHTPNHMAQLIRNYDIVCFDLFDTLIQRKLTFDQDRFEYLEFQLDREFDRETRFQSLREKALALAQEKFQKKEVTFTELYQSLKETKELPEEILERAKALEFELDLTLWTPRPRALGLLEQAKQLGRTLYLIEDTYYESKEVGQILEKTQITNNTHFKEIILSSEQGKNKQDGSLWRHLTEERKIFQKATLSIGCETEADLKRARDCGIRPLHVISGPDLRDLSTLARSLERLDEKHWSPQQKIFFGLITSRIFNDPVTHYTLHSTKLNLPSFKYNGYVIYGPLFWFFFCAMKDHAERMGATSLHFVGIGAKVLQETYTFFQEHFPFDLPHTEILGEKSLTVGMGLSNPDEILGDFNLLESANILEGNKQAFALDQGKPHAWAYRYQELLVLFADPIVPPEKRTMLLWQNRIAEGIKAFFAEVEQLPQFVLMEYQALEKMVQMPLYLTIKHFLLDRKTQESLSVKRNNGEIWLAQDLLHQLHEELHQDHSEN